MNRIEMGLKISLILFVVIAIALGITTWVFKKQYDEAVADKNAAQSKATTESANASRVTEDLESLKQIIGYSDEPKMIVEHFKEDMKTIAPDAENPTYVSVIASLRDKLRTKENDLKLKQDSLLALNEKFSKREAATKGNLEKMKERELAAANRLKEEEAKLQATLASNAESLNKTVATTKDQIKRQKGLADEAQARVETIETAFGAQAKQLQTARDIAAAKETPPMDNPQGKVSFVEANGEYGTIDLGSAANVTRGLMFSVYEPRDMSKQGLKGSVEVINIENARTSQVRITSTDINNPIISGDVIYTPSWQPGFQTRYALLGKMDVKGNGQNDVATVRALVAKNGAKVDAYQREDGAQEGRITDATTIAIVGTQPDDKSGDVALSTYTNMSGDVTRFGMKRLRLGEFLAQSGYVPTKNQYEGIQTTSKRPSTPSTGKVSSAYSDDEPKTGKRQPPNTAY